MLIHCQCYLDGTNYVMLSGETANSNYTKAAVQIMARVYYEAEAATNFDSFYQAMHNFTLYKFGFLNTSEYIASSVIKAAISGRAKGIVVCYKSGNTARQVTEIRPGLPIQSPSPLMNGHQNSFKNYQHIT